MFWLITDQIFEFFEYFFMFTAATGKIIGDKIQKLQK